jgi:hypothetical protein
VFNQNPKHGYIITMAIHPLAFYPSMRMADEYMCIAVANIYGCTLHVHRKIGPLTYKPFEATPYCTIHLAYYSASDWQHYRSTRKITSPPASPGPANSALQPADDDVFYLFLQKQKIGAELHIYLEEGTYHKRLFRA